MGEGGRVVLGSNDIVLVRVYGSRTRYVMCEMYCIVGV